MKLKVAITGGHLTPALAVIDELRKEKSEIHFIGREYAMEGDTSPSVESQTIKKLNIPFYPLVTGRLQRRLTRHTIPSLSRVPYGFWQARALLREIKPDIVLSFGGYLALPVVIAAKIQKIPVITHEQTVVFGLSNKIISQFADKVAVSWEDSLKHFPERKAVLTGNPLREELHDIKRKPTKPKLYFTGGNQGAHIINEAVFEILPELLEQFEVVHQTGTGANTSDYQKAEQVQKQLPKSLKSKYIFKPWFDTKELVKIMSDVTLVISRSGANTITELATLGIPSILIPIPWVVQDEQTKNARILEQEGSALILREQELTSKKLYSTIILAHQRIDEMEKNAKNLKKSFKNNAAAKIVELVKTLAEKNS